MKCVQISTPLFVLLFSYVILLAHASAEVPEGLKNATISHHQRHRVARRLAGKTEHGPSHSVKGLDMYRPDAVGTENWAGAWQANVPGGAGSFNSISAKWQIPDVQAPTADPNTEWQVTAFIGFDGNYKSCDALFQAGTTTYCKLDANGNLQTRAAVFAEWYPANEIELQNFAVKVGDTVQVKLQATTSIAGTVEVINLTNGGASVTFPMSAPSAKDAICGQTADFIVENPVETDGYRPPFAKFSPYYFTECVAGTDTGLTTDLTGATEVVMYDQPNKKYLATPTIVSKNELKVNYGPP